MSKNDISEDTLQNITKGVTFSQSISSIFRVTFSLAVDTIAGQPFKIFAGPGENGARHARPGVGAGFHARPRAVHEPPLQS